MHLLAAQPGGFADGEGIIDLDQSPADMVILSAADGVLAMLAEAAERLPAEFPSLRLANWRNLSKPAALDLYRDRTLDRARVVVVSLIGGRAYWPYGVEQLTDWAGAAPDRQLIVVPGEDYHDDEVFALSTVDYDTAHRVWRYTREGGADNAEALMRFVAATCLDQGFDWREPQVLARALIHHPQRLPATLADSPAARAFAAMLPLECSLADFHATEKIADLPARLPTDDAPHGVDAAVGDIAYYAPWGNLALFYRDFGHARGLVRLGRITGDVAVLASPGPLPARIERVPPAD